MTEASAAVFLLLATALNDIKGILPVLCNVSPKLSTYTNTQCNVM